MCKLRLFARAAIAALCIVTITSCDSDEEIAQVAVSIEGINNSTEVYAGEVLEIQLFATTTSSSLSRALIESYDLQRGRTVLEDIPLNQAKWNYNYYYTAPTLKDNSTTVKFTFAVTDNTGFTRTIVREIRVLRRDSPLEERSGVVLYCSDLDGMRPDAYCFSEMRPVIRSLVNPDLVDLYIPGFSDLELPDPQNPPVLIREWRTGTDLNFARSNSFDYSNATSTTIASAYESSIRAPKVTNLRSGDVILIGRETLPMAVIQVVDIIEGTDVSNSRYLLNIKAIKKALPFLPQKGDESEE